ncbi:queuosine precursor transporter [Azorhizobium doebereinerae]|uniref:queuosine precursor transporter n=1 Tax=Azorhizobium doebereinerae TaxID=281091 RepID=UPI0004096495|nr:queuosine precursor transporter [Azorhizobium doebereinerae]
MTSEPRAFALAVFAMCAAVLTANVLVQFPFTPFGLEDYLTYGAFTYPVTFLVNDLTNRRLGLVRTRRVIYVGFALAVLLSVLFATPRIALASGAAFLTAQLLDAAVFNRLRRRAWWMPPAMAGLISSALDTVVFFSLAFAGTGLPWTSWALCDYGVKLAMILVFLGPYKVIIARMPVWQPAPLRA